MYVNVCVDVDIEDILSEMSDEDVKDLYEKRFDTRGIEETSWPHLYEKRVHMTEKAFLDYIDKIIMDNTGRIICGR